MTIVTSDQHIDRTDAATDAPSGWVAAIFEPTADMVEAAFTSVLADIEGMAGECPIVATERRTASTLYVEALIAYREGNVDSAAIALHLSRFWATGRV